MAILTQVKPIQQETTAINGGRSAVPEMSADDRKNNFDYSHWTPEERSLVKELFTTRASPNLAKRPNVAKRYAQVVLKLQEKKTINDVALHYQWMAEKAAYQQMKPSSHGTSHSKGVHNAQLSNPMDSDECLDDEISYKATGGAASQVHNDQAKNKFSANGSAFKEKAAYKQVKPSSHATNHSNGVHHADSMDSDEDIDTDISYEAMQLLEQNEQAMNQIAANISAFKGYGNKHLILQVINYIDALMNESLSDLPEMEQSTRQRYNCAIINHLKTG